MTTSAHDRIDSYLSAWTEDPGDTKTAFLNILEELGSKEDTKLSFKDRSGICHSLRATRASQEWRPYFILVDVIDDDPADRWLSVCFYADTVDDPKGLGNHIPQGIKNLDGHCFDLEKGWDQGFLDYIKARIDQAYIRAETL